MLQKTAIKIRQKLFHRLRKAMVTFSRDCQLMERYCSSPDKLYVEHEGEITLVLLADLGLKPEATRSGK
jgi:hypothetical protein